MLQIGCKGEDEDVDVDEKAPRAKMKACTQSMMRVDDKAPQAKMKA